MSQSTLSRQTTSNLLFPTPSTSTVIPRSKIVCRLLKATNIASRQERNNLNPKTSLPCGIDLCRSHVTLHPLQRQTFSTVAVSSKTRNVSSCCIEDRDASKADLKHFLRSNQHVVAAPASISTYTRLVPKSAREGQINSSNNSPPLECLRGTPQCRLSLPYS